MTPDDCLVLLHSVWSGFAAQSQRLKLCRAFKNEGDQEAVEEEYAIKSTTYHSLHCCPVLLVFVCLIYEHDGHRVIYADNPSLSLFTDWSGANDHERVQRQLSVSSDSKLLDDDIREETKVIMRPKKPPRPKSEVFLNKQDPLARRKRFSAFGVSDVMRKGLVTYELVRRSPVIKS